MSTPVWVLFLENIESSGGRLKFPPEIAAWFESPQIETYPLLYENPDAGPVIPSSVGFDFPFDELQAILATPETRGQVAKEFLASLNALDPIFDFPSTPAEEEKRGEALAALDDEFRAQVEQLWAPVMRLMLAQFYDYLSVVVHGEKLSSLVAQAKTGNDEAFGKAVQIDDRIPSTIPYFKSRKARAKYEGDQKFLAMVGRKTFNPSYKGRIEHKAVWVTFAYLQTFGLLSGFTGEQLLDFCQSLGIAEDIVDVKNMQKILARFSEFQKRGGLSTP